MLVGGPVGMDLHSWNSRPRPGTSRNKGGVPVHDVGRVSSPSCLRTKYLLIYNYRIGKDLPQDELTPYHRQSKCKWEVHEV